MSSFTMVPNALLMADADPYTLAVFVAVKKHFPNMHPGIRTVARTAKCSHVTVIRRLKKLAAMGVLTIHRGRRGQVHNYTVSDAYLTPMETKAQRQGNWKGLSVLTEFFARKKEVINHRVRPELEVVNAVKSNKKEIQQEGSYEPILDTSQIRDRAQAFREALLGV